MSGTNFAYMYVERERNEEEKGGIGSCLFSKELNRLMEQEDKCTQVKELQTKEKLCCFECVKPLKLVSHSWA